METTPQQLRPLYWSKPWRDLTIAENVALLAELSDISNELVDVKSISAHFLVTEQTVYNLKSDHKQKRRKFAEPDPGKIDKRRSVTGEVGIRQQQLNRKKLKDAGQQSEIANASAVTVSEEAKLALDFNAGDDVEESQDSVFGSFNKRTKTSPDQTPEKPDVDESKKPDQTPEKPVVDKSTKRVQL